MTAFPSGPATVSGLGTGPASTPVADRSGPTTAERWAAVPRRWRVVMVALAAVVAVELAVSLAQGVAGSPSPVTGPSSSLDRTATGTSALAALLAEEGDRVQQDAVPLADARPPSGATVLVLDPSWWTSTDGRALVRFLDSGDRVVLAGPPAAAGLYRRLLGGATPPRWSPGAPGPGAAVPGPSPLVAGVGAVDGGASGRFDAPGATSVVVQATWGSLVVVWRPTGAAGRRGGSLVLAANATALQNGGLAQRDDALLALDLVGRRGTTVVFDEYDHGVGRSGTGLDGLPLRWRVGLGTVLAAAVLWVLQAARRFGPPEPAERELPPARGVHIDAMGNLLAALPRAQLATAVEPLRAEGRQLLCRSLGLGPGADDAAILLAADLAGRRDEALAVLEPPGDDKGLVRMGRAVGRLARPPVNRP